MGIAPIIVVTLNLAWLGLLVASFVRPGRWVLAWGIAGIALAVAVPVVAVAATLLAIRLGQAGAAAVPAAEKATFLASGIAEAMNFAAAGLVGSFPLWVLAIVLVARGLRLRRQPTGG